MDIHDMLLNRECVAIRHKIAVIFWVGKTSEKYSDNESDGKTFGSAIYVFSFSLP